MAAVLERLTEEQGIQQLDEQQGCEELETGVRPFAWTVDAFYRAIGAGVFEHPERLELLEGEIFENMSPQLTPHAQATGRTSKQLTRVFGEGKHIRIQTPLNISQATEPEPDVMVVIGEWEDFDDRKPTPGDVL